MDLKHVTNFEALKQAKNAFYEGEFKALQNAIKTALGSEKAALGKALTKLKNEAEVAFSNKQVELEATQIAARLANEWVDIAMPLTKVATLHPLTLVSNRFRDWFISHGYKQLNGGEITSVDLNFSSLNVPADHPARDAHDSLYINEKLMLRTHNTGFSAEALKAHANEPFAAFVIGRVYRNDADDQTHSHQFTQVDFVAVDHKLSLRNLLWTLTELLSYVLETPVKVRLRPSYFPFTEPSVEVDIFYRERWIEVLGSGMLHLAVMQAAGYTNNMQAFAAGIGVERMAMIKYNVADIREFYTNDWRFLSHFAGRS